MSEQAGGVPSLIACTTLLCRGFEEAGRLSELRRSREHPICVHSAACLRERLQLRRRSSGERGERKHVPCVPAAWRRAASKARQTKQSST